MIPAGLLFVAAIHQADSPNLDALRWYAAEILPASGLPGTDYVLVARQGTVARPFESLKADLAQALAAAHLKLDRAGENR